jgi:hypothetical protein
MRGRAALEKARVMENSPLKRYFAAGLLGPDIWERASL